MFVAAGLVGGRRGGEPFATEQRKPLGAALQPAPPEVARHEIDGIRGHVAVRRELAARDGDDAALGVPHGVAPREIGGARAGGRAEQRPEPGPRAHDVVFGHLLRRGTVEGAQEVRHVVGRALRIVDRAVVVGVGRADVREITPRDDEHRPPVVRDRHDRGDVVAHLRPRHRDVHSLCGADRLRVSALVECPHLVGPHARGVDDTRGPHVELPAVGFDASTVHPALLVLQERHGRRVVRNAPHRSRQPCGQVSTSSRASSVCAS